MTEIIFVEKYWVVCWCFRWVIAIIMHWKYEVFSQWRSDVWTVEAAKIGNLGTVQFGGND